MEVGAHSDAHFQFVSQDAFLSPGTFYVVKRYQRAAKAKSLRHRTPSYEGARITPGEAAQNPTHAQSRQGDSKR